MEIQWLADASRRKRWLIGVSGGLDSVALLHLLHESGFRHLVVCHLDHGLRGEASDGDAQFVRKLGEKLGYTVELGQIDLVAFSKQQGTSLETAGRRARHNFFAECSRKHRCDRLLLAHHSDDQAETVLWNLIRGSSMCRGMQGKKTLQMDGRRMHVERPLLGIRKRELADWMVGKKLKWREDASNAVNDVIRNRLRNIAIPLLSEIANRDVIPILSRAAIVTDEWTEMMEWSLEKAAVRDPQGRLHLPALRGLPEFLKQYALVDLLKSKDVPTLSTSLLESCAKILEPTGPPSVNLPGGGRLRRKAGRVFVEPAKH